MTDAVHVLLFIVGAMLLLRVLLRVFRGLWPAFWTGLWSSLFLRWLVVPRLVAQPHDDAFGIGALLVFGVALIAVGGLMFCFC